MIQDLYERSKRDSSSSSSSGSDDSSNSGSDTTTPVDECTLLGDYIAADLVALPADFNDLINATLVAQVAPVFFALLTSAPTLFADLSLAITSAASNPVTIEAGVFALAALAPDFVALANDACGLSLSPEVVQNADGLFSFVLPAFLLF